MPGSRYLVVGFACACLGVAASAPALPVKLDLSNTTPAVDRGGRSGDDQYTAPNGTLVTSSHPTWVNSNFYYIEYLFNETYGTGEDHTHYWLSGGSPPLTLDFAFDQTYEVDFVRVYPRGPSKSGFGDRASDYELFVSTTGLPGSWTSLTGGMVITDDDEVGDFHDHAAAQQVNFVRFNLSQAASLGGALAEVEFYVVPEPTALVLMALAAPLALGRRRRRC